MANDIVVFFDPDKPHLPTLVAAYLCFANRQKTNVKVAPRRGQPTTVQLIRTKEVLVGKGVAARFLARLADQHVGSALYGGGEAWSAAEVDFFVELGDRQEQFDDAPQTTAFLELLDQHLASRTLMVGYRLSLADAAVWGALRLNSVWKGALLSGAAKAKYPHVARWYAFCEAAPEFARPQEIYDKLDPKEGAGATAEEKKQEKQKTPEELNVERESDLELPGAKMGQVVTRFPPEPSGYLHIGHTKAALLNDYFARRWRGKLILRFDDTNPSKENEDFVENIKRDLATLGIRPDHVSSTSDHFPVIEKYARQLIREGKAYVDDTPVDELREQRGEGVESRCRNNTPEQNLKMFEEMLAGSPQGLKCVLRAKIDMSALNKTLRDPVLYRCNLTPHHSTGTRYKAYPTYDFACPIVDSIEGVTHALRTTEYHERNEQYYWIIDALGLRKPYIWDFGRLGFKYTVMSKRRLQWFVDKGIADGWNDPRFPTVQGIFRRGLTLDALRDFIRLMGQTKNLTLMEWDKIWAINKQYIDPVAPRYNAVAKEAMVPLRLKGAPEREERKVALHPKNDKVGEKTTAYTSTVWLEQDDAKTVAEGEEITLMAWGNCVVRKVTRSGAGGMVAEMEGELHLDGDPKKTDKKLHWVPHTPDQHVPITMVEFDHLITVEKLEENMKFEDVIRPQSRYETPLVGEAALRNIKVNDIIQLQRRGFFRCEREFRSAAEPLVLFLIPTGKEKNMSNLSYKVGAQKREPKPATKG